MLAVSHFHTVADATGEMVQDVDEKLLYDTFSAFGVIVTNPKVPFRYSLMSWFGSVLSVASL